MNIIDYFQGKKVMKLKRQHYKLEAMGVVSMPTEETVETACVEGKRNSMVPAIIAETEGMKQMTAGRMKKMQQKGPNGEKKQHVTLKPMM